MATYVVRRLIQAIPIVFGISLLIFLIVQLAPGDPTDRFRVPTVRPEQLENLRRLYGLDEPLPQQYISWITAFFQIWRVDCWGYSIATGDSVRNMVFERLPATALLMGTAEVVTIVFAIPIGIVAAVKQYSLVDKVISVFATIGYAIPSFIIGLYVLYFGGVVLGWFPLFGMQSLGKSGDPLDVAWHLVLPVTSLAIQSIAGWARYVRTSMLESLHQDYVRTARAKGLAGSRVIGKHALRNALMPVVTLIGLSLPSLVAGAVITESIFSYPGVGSLIISAVNANDYPVIYATAMLIGMTVIAGNLLADVLYGLVDPRIKY
jgi:peptide/nickel transport system permease protein